VKYRNNANHVLCRKMKEGTETAEQLNCSII
jgi:hypothetical protein